jgi:hypothetical protein
MIVTLTAGTVFTTYGVSIYSVDMRAQTITLQLYTTNRLPLGQMINVTVSTEVHTPALGLVD